MRWRKESMELGELRSLFPSKWGKAEVCGACGKAFACGATLAGCWCAEVKLTEEQRVELKAKYQGCVCRECLEAAAAEGRTTKNDCRSKI